MAQPLLKIVSAPAEAPVADLGELSPERLPLIVRRAIRRGLWAPATAETLRDMARKIAEHRMAGYDVDILLPVLAQAISVTPPTSVPLDGVEGEIMNLASAMLAVPRAWNNPLLNAARSYGDLDELNDLIEMQIAGDQRVRKLNNVDSSIAFARIGELVEEAKSQYPQLGLSFGYIGGVHTWGDDRSWRVFAKLATRNCHGACDISFGSFATDRIGDMLAVMERDFADWLSTTAQRLTTGDIRQVR